MKKTALLTMAVFTASIVGLGFTSPASAEGDCSFGHIKKTAQSSSQQVAQDQPQQTPKPSGS